jgi:hypothetical protein
LKVILRKLHSGNITVEEYAFIDEAWIAGL